MNSGSKISFRKMNGLGNDFVILDARTRALKIDEASARAIADRDTGIGCDQLIVYDKSVFADIRMRIWNHDGGEVESCGNATRCVADILLEELGVENLSVETSGGMLQCARDQSGALVVDMGAPKFHWKEIPLAEEFRDTRAIELQIGPIDDPILHSPSVVNVGNPHCIFWVKDETAYDLSKVGPLLESHPIFPERANISLARVVNRGHIVLNVWERGVGITRACGTAACAVIAAAVRKGLVDREITVTLPGGDLQMKLRDDDDHILMIGPVAYEFDGVLPDGLMTT